MHIIRPLVLGLASVIVLSGCGGGGSSSGAPAGSSSSSTGAAPVAASCDQVTAAMVNSALGTNVGAPSQTSGGSGTVACQYQSKKGDVVVIRIQTDSSAATFAAERKGFETTGQPTKDYAGFGDEAFSNTKKMPLGLPDENTLVARQSSVEVLVSSSASLSAERALEQEIFAKVK